VVFCSFAFPEGAWVNLLSSHAVDPIILTPEFKACAVRIEKIAAEPAGTAVRAAV
jgi:hypothetical protein